MRIYPVLICLVISGCATDTGRPLFGAHGKNGNPVRYERLGSITDQDVSTGPQCGSKQVSWCTERRERQNCQCLNVHEAEEKVRRMTAQFRGPGN